MSVKVIDLLKGYKDIKLKIEMLTNEKEVLLESVKIESIVENEEDRIRSLSLQAVCWDRELIIGGIKIADEKINKIIGISKEQHNMSKEEVDKRVGEIEDKIKMLNRLIKMIDSLLKSLKYNERFVLVNHFIEGMTFEQIAELFYKEFKLSKSDSAMRSLKRRSLLKLQQNFNKL